MNENILYVWAYPQDAAAPLLCGSMELLQGRHCLFQYANSWVERDNAFALAPDMPLQLGNIEPPGGLDLHPILEDAGPDRWGKNIINKVFNPRRRSPLEYLERAGEDRIGALGFSRSEDRYEVSAEQSFQVADLPDLIRAAQAINSQAPIDEETRRLLRPGASAGGARPKAVVMHDGVAWIAKFPTPDDDVDVSAIEHASLQLAKACGIAVPESHLVDIGGHNVLLVKRFDREEGGSRLHFASARTLLLADGVSENDAGYSDLADVARRHASAPKESCLQLFRRMAVNVFLDNTDDHAKNHAFLLKDGQWHLAPAYDIQPQLQGVAYQQLKVGRLGYAPTAANVLSEASRFLLKPEDALEELSGIRDVLVCWPEIFEAAGVSSHDIDHCRSHILRPGQFEFGNVPDRFKRPEPACSYSGKMVAINQDHAYQHVGRSDHIQHDKGSLQPLPLPEQAVTVKYGPEKVVVEPQKSKSRGLERK